MLSFGESFCEDQPEVQTDFENEECRIMSDSRIYFAGSAARFSTNGDSARDQNSLDTTRQLKAEEEQEPGPEPAYLATSPNGTTLHIPKELFVALSDFMQTRKCPGSITIQFRKGEIVCVEAVAKKTYRRP